MVKFAVCDDEREMTDYISDKLREYYPGDCEIRKYEDGESLLADSRKQLFDALFLDIDMPDLDGMELAKRIREDNQYVKIVFVTNKNEFVFKGYVYGAFRYIMKSELETELRETTDSLKKYFDSMNEYLDFKTPTGNITRAVKDIKYFEVRGHTVTMVCDLGEDRISGTMKECDNRMKSRGFIRIHKGYLVNFRCIYSIETKNISLTKGGKLPLSRNRAEEVKKKLQEFSRSMGV